MTRKVGPRSDSDVNPAGGVEWVPEGFKADPRYLALLRRIGLE
jgi:hypothetical protein